MAIVSLRLQDSERTGADEFWIARKSTF